MTGWNLVSPNQDCKGVKEPNPYCVGENRTHTKVTKAEKLIKLDPNLKHFGMIPPGYLSRDYFAYRSTTARSTNQLNFVP